MLAYINQEYDQKIGLLLLGLCILIGIGVWIFRKRWVVASIIGFIVLVWGMMIIPGFVPARGYAQRAVCINNLKAIVDAKARWAVENHKQKTDAPTDSDLFGEDRYLKSKPECPAGGTYILGRLDENPKCSLAEAKDHKIEGTNN